VTDIVKHARTTTIVVRTGAGTASDTRRGVFVEIASPAGTTVLLWMRIGGDAAVAPLNG